MADHPFDDEAVDAAEAAISKNWDRHGYRDFAILALTAACKSMKERGLIVDAVALWRGDSVIAVTGIGQDDYAPVTIIRHKEQP